ncbi:hypothetical protein GCM10010329_02070 [Streptomyces spiroverticillatus]|uniref:Integral membrane protein n=1 Tax=Streptomyces finlayi TaxID=67296 RepID=A0A918WSB3_9ACTN|nr:DUF6113 family protein [Streptomyces finlayi]GGZ85989.1 hypothetical protein GCM10010329_02070 [Streptomyces spiroverticillatus]GHC77518.1 hypothetical protein GCM10010334_02060 [Streptomyces finlayi]
MSKDAKPSGPAPGRRSVARTTGTPSAAAPSLLLTQPVNPRRIPLYLGLFVLGALTGIAGGLVSGALMPLGLLLSLLGAGGLFYGGTYALGTRLGAAVPGLGWLLAVLVTTSGRTEGDVLIGGGTGASIFLIGGIVLAVICATMPRLPVTAKGTARPGN